MTAGTLAPHRSPLTPERESFWQLLHAEWTKFRTVPGWVVAMLVMIVAIPAFAFLSTNRGIGCVNVPSAPARSAARYSRPGLAVCRS
jgi:hypothetical protein